MKLPVVPTILGLVAICVLAAAGCGSSGVPSSPSAVASNASSSSFGSLDPISAIPAREGAKRTILCFGDSLTFGTTSRAAPGFATLSPIEGYVPKLQRLLEDELDEKLRMVNSSRGGGDTNEGLARLPNELRIHNPDLVLLWLGIVDVNTNEKARFTQLRENLVAMMRMIKREGAKVVIGTYPPMDPEGFRALVPEKVARLNAIIRQEANAEQVPIAGHEIAFGNDPDGLLGSDGLHPNDNGYQLIAETWFEVVRDLEF
ncbi:MAG: SGNH/GDSL hydrolase family protein [Vicinamibacteria bacterium]